MDKTEVKRVLVPYCPPLGSAHVEQIASELADLSQKEVEAAKAEAEKRSEKTLKKSRSPKRKRVKRE